MNSLKRKIIFIFFRGSNELFKSLLFQISFVSLTQAQSNNIRVELAVTVLHACVGPVDLAPVNDRNNIE